MLTASVDTSTKNGFRPSSHGGCKTNEYHSGLF